MMATTKSANAEGLCDAPQSQKSCT